MYSNSMASGLAFVLGSILLIHPLKKVYENMIIVERENSKEEE